VGYSAGCKDTARDLPEGIQRLPLEDIAPRSAEMLLIDNAPSSTSELAAILDRASQKSRSIVEWRDTSRSISDWREVFQALGFTVESASRIRGARRAVLSRTMPVQQSKHWSIILPRLSASTGFERLYEWIGFFQRFDSIINTEITLVEDVPLAGNEEMLRNLEREGFFQRKTHFRPAGLLECIRTGVLFSSGRRVLIDGDERIPVTEALTLLEAGYPLDQKEEFYRVHGIAVSAEPDLKRKFSQRMQAWKARHMRGFPERLLFSLMSAEAAQRIFTGNHPRLQIMRSMPATEAIVMRR
jgi:hypothetical protein